MYPQSTYDCYCKKSTSSDRQRNRIYSEKDRTTREPKCSVRKKTVRSGKSIPWSSARVVDEESPDTKRCTAMSPPTPILSPETTNALESAERMIKDTQIQMAEISTILNRNHPRLPIKLDAEEPTIDDEDDQLLYVRERVLLKFHEANYGGGDYHEDEKNEESLSNEKSQLSTKKIVDFSAPKFQTSAKRCEDYLNYVKSGFQERKTVTESMKNLDSVCPSDMLSNKRIEEREISSPRRKTEDSGSKKIGNFCVQVGPMVNIDRKLITHNLEGVHISPDPSFVQENANVATYNLQHKSNERSAPSKQKEKVAKISEANENVNDSVRTLTSKPVEEEFHQINQAFSEKEENSMQLTSKIDVQGDQECAEVGGQESLIDDAFTKTVRNTELNKVSQINEEEGSELDEKQLVEIEETIRNEENGEKNVKERKDFTDLRDNDNADEKFVKSEQHDITKYEMKLEDPSSLQMSKAETRKRVSFLSKKEKEKREKEERYEIVDQRFNNVFKTYCKQRRRDLKMPDREILLTDVSESAEEIEENLDEDFYYPAIDELDEVIAVYDKMLDGIAGGNENIEEFLSRPEFAEYCASEEQETMKNCELFNSYNAKDKLGTKKIHSSHHFRRQNHHKGFGSEITLRRNEEEETKDLGNRNTKMRSLLPVKKRNDVNAEDYDFRKKLEKFEELDESRRNELRKKSNEVRTKLSTDEFVKPICSFGKYNRREKRVVPEESNNSEIIASMNSSSSNSELKVQDRNFAKKFDKSGEFDESNMTKRCRSLNELRCKLKEETKRTSKNGTDNHFLMKLNEAKSFYSLDRSNRRESSFFQATNISSETISSMNPSSSSWDEKEKRESRTISKSSIDDVNEIKCLEFDIASVEDRSKFAKMNLEKVNYTIPCTKSEFLKEPSSEANNSTSLKEAACIFADKKKIVKDTIINITKETEITCATVKKLLENLPDAGNFKMRDFGLFILKTLLTNHENSESALSTRKINDTCLKLDCNTKEENPEVKCLEDKKNVGNENVEAVKKIVESTENEVGSRITYNESVGKSKGKISSKNNVNNTNSKQEYSKIINETNDIISEDESLKEISNIKSDGKNTEDEDTSSSVDLKVIKTNEENTDIAIASIDNKNEQDSKDNNQLIFAASSLETGNKNKNSCMQDINQETLDQDITSNGDKENSVKSHLLQSETENLSKVASRTCKSPVKITLASDSLNDCVSFEATLSSRKMKKPSTNDIEIQTDVFSRETKESEKNSNASISSNQSDQRNSLSKSLPKKEVLLDGIVSVELGENMCKNVLSSVRNTSDPLSVNYSLRSFSGSSETESNKVEISDGSHSEGELYMPSSCSYSLGEVKVLRTNNLRVDNESESESSTVFVVKNMLASWNESSNSQIQSVGEV